MKKRLLIINSITGGGRNKARAFDLINRLSANDYAVTVFPVSADNQIELADYLKDNQYDSVVCVGGDGTLNRTVNEVMKTSYRPVIGYIPSGTCNDFAKNLPLSTDFYQACKIINNDKTVSYDLGRFNDQYFMYVASFGSISSVSYNTDQQSKNFLGYAAYAAYALSMLPEILSAKCHLRVETDEETFEGDYLFGAIANSLSVAGVKINTMSYEDLMDGEFELLLVKCPEHIQDVGSIAIALLNSEFDNPYLEFRKIKRAHIYTTANTEWTLDGEYGGNPEEITFEIREKAIDIAVDTKRIK